MLKRRCQSSVLRRAAPDREARDPRQHGEVAPQRKMIRRGSAAHPAAAPPSRASVACDPRGAPVVAGRVRIGREQIFVRGSHAGLRRPRDRVVARHVVGTERVIEQQKRRHDRRARPVAGPARVRIFRRQHAVVAAERDQPLVMRDAALRPPAGLAASRDRDCPASRSAARSAAAASAARSRDAPAFRRCRRR